MKLLPTITLALLAVGLANGFSFHMHKRSLSIPPGTPRAQRRGFAHAWSPVVRSPGPHGMRWKSVKTTAEKNSDIDLYGGILALGEYYAEIYIGGQVFFVQVDTGSSTAAVVAQGCGCVQANGPYSPTSTAKTIACSDHYCTQCQAWTDGPPCSCSTGSCDFQVSYGDGSGATGPLYSDKMSIGSSSAPAVMTTFGAITTVIKNFNTPATDGILGVAYNRLNLNGVPTLLDNLHSGGHLANYTFGMCLTEAGGTMDLGEVVASRSKTAVQYTSTVVSPQWGGLGYYAVTLNTFTVNGQNVAGWNNALTIVDSGTTLMVFPQATVDSLETIVEAINPPHFNDDCIQLTSSEAAQWPDMVFTFPNKAGGADITVTVGAMDYLLDFNGCMVPGFQVGDDSTVILGDSFMQTSYVVFDQGNQQVGFAPLASCPVPPSKSKSNTVGIVVGVLGALIGVGCIVALVLFCRRRRRSGGGSLQGGYHQQPTQANAPYQAMP